jgi:hypothetical protein
LIAYYKHAEIYAVSWNACTPTSFLSHGTFGKLGLLNKESKEQKENNKKEKSQKRESRSDKFNNLINFMNTAKRQFVYAVEQASVTGTLLAMFLSKSSFAENRAVTVIGFSLGGVVTFNMLKILKRLHDFNHQKAGRVINDIQFWAGAYVLDLNKQYKEIYERAQYGLVVNGHLNNFYSEKDLALKIGFPMIFRG